MEKIILLVACAIVVCVAACKMWGKGENFSFFFATLPVPCLLFFFEEISWGAVVCWVLYVAHVNGCREEEKNYSFAVGVYLLIEVLLIAFECFLLPMGFSIFCLFFILTDGVK